MREASSFSSPRLLAALTLGLAWACFTPVQDEDWGLNRNASTYGGADGGAPGDDAGPSFDAGAAPDSGSAVDAGAPVMDSGVPYSIPVISPDAGMVGMFQAYSNYVEGNPGLGMGWFATTYQATGLWPVIDTCWFVGPGTGGDGGSWGLTPDAGTVSLVSDGQQFLFAPNGGGFSMSPSTPLWNGGETVYLTGTGGDVVPAFSLPLVAPSPVTVVAGAPTGTTSRSSDLTFTWTGTTAGAVRITILMPDAPLYSVGCAFSPGPGTGIVPASLLEQLPTGWATWSVYSEDDGLLSVDPWVFYLSAYTGSLVPGGGPAGGSFTLQ
jgi:hypothetical protein